MTADARSASGSTAADVLPSAEQHRGVYRLALALTLLLIGAVLIALPIALRSVADVLFSRQERALYDLTTGRVITPAAAAASASKESYFNLAVVAIDERDEAVTLALSGNRICPGVCPTVRVTLFALEDDLSLRRGVPPSATMTLQPTDLIYTDTLQLPIRGQPSLYPFDVWQLKLGAAVGEVRPDGTVAPLSPAVVRTHAAVTLQNQLTDFVLQPPVALAPPPSGAASGQVAYLSMQALTFVRPAYLKVLSIILIVLIAVSGVLALCTRSMNDLALGIGGLILGVWGVRSIMIPQPVPTVTAIDLALSTVILLLLLGLAVRAALHFHQHSDLPWPRPRRRG